MFKNGMRLVHPGEILREDYLVPLGMSAKAKALNVPKGVGMRAAAVTGAHFLAKGAARRRTGMLHRRYTSSATRRNFHRFPRAPT